MYNHLIESLQRLVKVNRGYALQYIDTNDEKYRAYTMLADMYQRQLDAMMPEKTKTTLNKILEILSKPL